MKSLFYTITFFAVSGFTLWSACSGGKQVKDNGNSPIAAVLDGAFELKHNQTALMESENLSIKFTDVPEDSRCPVGVECIWQGQAGIDLEIKKQENEPETIRLTSNAGEPELAEKPVGDLYIRLVKVEPAKTTDRELKLSDYKITLTISRNTESRD
jgi:hypothetical protein